MSSSQWIQFMEMDELVRKRNGKEDSPQTWPDPAITDPKAPQKDPKFSKEILIATSLPDLVTSQRWMGPGTILPPAFGGGILPEGLAGPPPRV